jgi:pyruvate,water dikinase
LIKISPKLFKCVTRPHLLFPAAAGLLVERGSLLSHSAIVSRELRLPCIVSLPGITTTLKTGDLVEMDGALGTVRVLES